jgi:hypothetical protein
METKMNAAEMIARAKAAGVEAQQQHPGKAGRTWRAIRGYEMLVELIRYGYQQSIALEILDPNIKIKSKPAKPTMYKISERHIRRVRRIAETGKLAVLIFCAKNNLSLETAEHMIIKPSIEMIEAAWEAATPEQRTEFLRRLKNKQ